MEMSEYVIKNIDKAVEENYIQVYYHPVARTITGEICAMEALARWNDPEYGLLSPAVFIEALEGARLIHKLDSYIVRKVCEDYKNSQVEGIPFMPVSFNLSRLDFRLCDMIGIINKAASENNVPLDMLRVEITESVIADDRNFMHDIFDKLASLGYRIWMDDFGSGYSSLNFLKDFDFETLKIDMLFLSDFNDRSRSIITSIVDMAKKIGIHTLAEGAETKEQVDFLRSIGCEKVQGYYFGKPLPYRETLENIQKRGFKIESLNKRKYYHDIASVNILSATPFISTKKSSPTVSIEDSQIPLAIMSCINDELHYLFANDAYIQELKSIGISSLNMDETLYLDKKARVSENFYALANKANESGNVEVTDFIIDNHYCRMDVKRIAGYSDGFALLCMLRNYSKNSMVLQRSSLDETLRSLYSIYNRIELIDLETGYSRNLFLSRHIFSDYDKAPTAEELQHFAKHEVYAEDYKRFLDFYELETVEERIKKSGLTYLSSWFRLKNIDGNYIWTLILLIAVGSKKIMSCERRLDENIQTELPRLLGVPAVASPEPDELLNPSLLWENMVMSANIPTFWKDSERRFVGANKCFLDYFGLNSVDVLIGKTDEDMNWHLNPDPYKKDEERVLHSGDYISMAPGKVLSKGVICDILASKCPIYKDGKIVGLMGYFFDMEFTGKLNSMQEKYSHRDPVTGTLDMCGFLNSGWSFFDAYESSGTDFAMICLKLSDYAALKNNYGKTWIEHLLKKAADRIVSVMGNIGIISRPGGGTFMLLVQSDNSEEVEKLIANIQNEIKNIRENDDIPCTVYLRRGYAFYSETGNVEELRILTMKRMTD
ncbi:MAG: EAL domain-containing protein [Lachnospiraceae bacterium]|nr:EAL domain-containing protein [Lachnospiraceae bacterium]